jgi:hypothetical protein
MGKVGTGRVGAIPLHNPVDVESAGSHVGQIFLQLGKVESRGKAVLPGFRRLDGVGFVHALVPPSSGGLLGVSPSQHGHARLVIGNGMDRVAVLGQGAGGPGLVRVELLSAVLLDLETEVNPAKE